MGKKLKAGVIGTGGISRHHISGYMSNPDVELYALCDIDADRVRAAGEKYNVQRTFTDMREMVNLPELDIISVCTWNSEHAPCAIAALEAGKHVLCEKPPATSAIDAIKMSDAAKKNNKLLMIGLVRRFGNDCDMLRELIDAGALGDLYYAKATYLRRHGCPGGWFGDKSRAGGGPMFDLGVHVLDLTRYLAGNPIPVSVYGVTYNKLGARPGIKTGVAYVSMTKSDKDIFDVEDLATALIRFDNGFTLSMEASFALNIKNDTSNIELFGTKGGARLSPELEIFTENYGYLTNLSFASRTSLDFNGLFQREIDHFVNCCLTNTQCKAPAEDGVTIMRILDAVYESARIGSEVKL